MKDGTVIDFKIMMSDRIEAKSPEAEAQEIEEAIVQLEAHRERLVQDYLERAKRSKLSKKQAMDQLPNQPELSRIDKAIDELRWRQAGLG